MFDMELKFHKQLDESCIYYVWKYDIAVCYHSENIDNLLHRAFFLRYPVCARNGQNISASFCTYHKKIHSKRWNWEQALSLND